MPAERAAYWGNDSPPNQFVSAILDGLGSPCYPPPLSTIRAFIFDMDGVLIHSMPLHTRAWEIYLQRLGVDVHDLERRMHGRRNEELMKDFLGASITAELAFQHGKAKERLYRELAGDATAEQLLVPGVLDFIRRHAEVPMAVASNAERENIDFALDRFGLRPLFRVAIDGLGAERPKPFPDIYLHAAAKLGVPTSECLVFEDSPAGVTAGLAAGMPVIAVETTPTEFSDKVELKIADFRDPKLENWLQSRL